MHRPGIASDDQSGSLTKSNQFFEICRNLPDGRRFLFDLSHQTLLTGPPCHHEREAVIHEPRRKLSISSSVPTFRRPVAAGVDDDVIGQTAEFLCNGAARSVAGLQRDFDIPVGINPKW